MRRYANITSPRANQLLAFILFEGMANPAGRTTDGKQGEPGAIGQLERVLQYSQGKVDGWRTTGDGRRFTYDRVGQRQHWRGWVEFREQGKQRRRRSASTRRTRDGSPTSRRQAVACLACPPCLKPSSAASPAKTTA